MPIYIIGAVDNPEAVKIGWSKDVFKRLSVFQISNHKKLTVLRIIDCCQAAEKWLHARYRHHRLDGEWFSIHPDMFRVDLPTDLRKVRRKGPPPRHTTALPIETLIGKRQEHLNGHHFDYLAMKWVARLELSELWDD